jgi:hypothetical protein
MIFTLIQTIAADPVIGMLRNYITGLIAIALLVLFKPLLTGVAKAILVAVKPPLTKEQRIARRQMRDSLLIKKMMNAATGPSDMAELRAMGCRG